MNTIVSQYFSGIVSGSDENINLAEATLYIAQIEYPHLDTSAYLSILDAMAAELREIIPIDSSAKSTISLINEYLFDTLGFSGNWRSFNDPRNSFLNEVLDRKLGIPISLSLLYMEIGKRLGLELYGVSFPGHFLVKLIHEKEEFIIDPFSGGVVLVEAELLERLKHFSEDRQSRWNLEELLQPASNKEVLIRILRNLKNIYIEVDDLQHALHVTNLQLILDPDSADGLRDRGFIYESLDCYRAASEDFQRYLVLNPAANDCQSIQSRLSGLQHSISRLH
ncbi:MAG: tetratricopeptide repeat protein [Gammaproteobacteria bacterium]|jgi:regulator of sirC expression with transglutaminase-like and TPR domain|nr:tetratricopeptide repeat protein [Gammaproteobacteria bacterium]